MFAFLKWLSVFIVLVIAVLITLLCSFSYFSLQEQPSIVQKTFINSSSAQQSKRLIKRVVRRLSINTHQPNAIVIMKESELKSLSALSHRAIPQLSSQVRVLPDKLSIALSYKTLLPAPYKYLNISVNIYPASSFLYIGEVKVGDISLQGSTLQALLTWGLNTFVKPELGDKLFSSITSLKISKTKVILTLNLPKDTSLLKEDKFAAFKKIRDDLALHGDVSKIRKYYSLLNAYARTTTNHSLSHYLSWAIREARTQTELHAELLAEQENKAALIALVLYFGSEKFELIVGDMVTQTEKEKSRQNYLRKTVTLNSRVDLQKHFVYSMALQLLGNSQASDALGEMKEFLDSNKGGSGFSFADLLADRAGTRFAMLATQSKIQAEYTQNVMRNGLLEAHVLPDISSLPEGISAYDFERVYKNINAQPYKKMLTGIDTQLSQLPLYQEVL